MNKGLSSQSEKGKRDIVESLVIEYLSKHKFREACLEVAAYEAKQPSQRGIGINWKNYDAADDIKKLETIFKKTPKLLIRFGLTNEKLEALRIAASMMLLWGENRAKKWLPVDFKNEIAISNDVAARMIAFLGTHQSTLERYRKEGVKYVEILVAPDSCESCNKLAGKHFKINDSLELPYEYCTNKMGCRCCYLAVLE